MSKKRVNRQEPDVHRCCICNQRIDSRESNVCTECLAEALKDTEVTCE